MKMNKSGFQISFAWLFAIIVGAFILFLAIYGVMKIVNTGEDVTSVRAGVEIGVLLNPLETGFESGQVNLLTMPVDTRIHNSCSVSGRFGDKAFGEQIIGISQKGIGDRWSQTDLDVRVENKYIFSESEVEGRSFFLFSKPFEFPFKVADLIYITSSKDDYCFVGSPSRIEEELSDLNQGNIFVENCPENSISVCFDNQISLECDIRVRYLLGDVQKDGRTMFFDDDALMYAAIFSESSIYECQVQRLLQRTDELSSIYIEKANLLEGQGCSSNINLLSFRNIIRGISSSSELGSASSILREIDTLNNRARCMLW